MAQHFKSSASYGLLLVIFGTTLFSSKSILIQLAYQAGATVDQLMLIRMLLALPFYLLLGIWAWRRLSKKPSLLALGAMALPGFATYHVASYLDMWALQWLSAGLERIILFTYPLLVVVLRAFRGETVTRERITGLLLAYGGILLFFYQDLQIYQQVSLLAVAAVFVAAILTANYLLASQRYGREYSSDFFTAVAMGITGLTVPTHYVAVHGANLSSIPPVLWWYGLVLSLFMTVLASILHNRGIARVGASTGAIASMLGPMITLTLAAWILEQPFTLLHAIATLVTVLGVALATQGEQLRSRLKQWGGSLAARG